MPPQTWQKEEEVGRGLALAVNFRSLWVAWSLCSLSLGRRSHVATAAGGQSAALCVPGVRTAPLTPGVPWEPELGNRLQEHDLR